MIKQIISNYEVRNIIQSVSRDLAQRFSNQLEPVSFLIVANGALHFGSEVLRDLHKRSEIKTMYDVVKIHSYSIISNMNTGVELITPPDPELVTGRHVVILDDIYDTGLTLAFLEKEVLALNPLSVTSCVMLSKQEIVEQKPNIVGMYVTSNAFLYGFGMDLNGLERNSSTINQVVE